MKSTDFKQPNIKLLKVPDVAAMLGISRALAYHLVQTGEIPSVHIRAAIRVRSQDLENYISQNLTGRKI